MLLKLHNLTTKAHCSIRPFDTSDDWYIPYFIDFGMMLSYMRVKIEVYVIIMKRLSGWTDRLKQD